MQSKGVCLPRWTWTYWKNEQANKQIKKTQNNWYYTVFFINSMIQEKNYIIIGKHYRILKLIHSYTHKILSRNKSMVPV